VWGLGYIYLALFSVAAGAENVPHASNPQSQRTRPQIEGASLYSSVPIGFDTYMKYGSRQLRYRDGSIATQGIGNACVSTLIARIPKADGVTCQTAFISAEHCIVGEKGEPLISWNVSLPGWPLGISNKSGRIAYRKKSVITGVDENGQPIDRGVEDVAVIHAEMPCAYLGGAKPARLAACDASGGVILGEEEELIAQKRTEPEQGNFGKGGRFLVRLASGVRDLFGRSLYSMQSVRNRKDELAQGGDSGGPIANKRGELVSVMARAAGQGEKSYFDPKAVCFAREKLMEWKMWPPVPESGDFRPETSPKQAIPQSFAEMRAPVNVVPPRGAEVAVRIDQDATGKKRLVLEDGSGTPKPVFAQTKQDGSIEWLFKNASTGKWETLPPAAHAKLVEFYRPYTETRERFEQAFGDAKDRRIVEGFLKPQWAARPQVSFASIAQPPAVRQPPIQRPGPGPNVGPVVANLGGAPASRAAGAVAHAPISSAQAQGLRQIVHRYENEKRYAFSGNQRYRMGKDFPGTFQDIPVGGTGKIIVGYYGNQNAVFESKFRGSAPFVEFRRYPINSREHQVDSGVFIVDGLGRKVIHDDAMGNPALIPTVQNEAAELNQYLSAKAKLQNPALSVAAANRPTIPQAPPVQNPPQAAAPAQGSHARGISSTEGIAASSARAVKPIDHSGYDLGSCIQCHTAGGKGPIFPSFVSQPEQWDRLLGQGDLKAQKWLKSFRDNVLGGEMLSKAGLSAQEGQGLAISKSIEALSEKHLSSTTRAASAVTQRSPQAWLIDPKKQAEYRSILASAAFKHPSLRAELQDFDVIWDKVGNPEWHWAAAKGSSGRGGARPVGASEAATALLARLFKKKPTGEEHWLEPFNKGFSVDESTVGLKSFSLMRLPRDANGKPNKCAYDFETKTGTLSQENPNQTTSLSLPRSLRDELPSFWASCPVGTTVYEVQYITSLGRPVILDVFSRTKDADSVSAVPSPNAFRPDSSPEAILSWIQRQTDTANPDYAVLRNAVRNPQRDQVASQINEDGRLGQPFIVGNQRSSTIAGSKSVIPRGAVSPQTLGRMYSELPLTSALGNQGWQLEAQDLFANSHRGIAVNKQNCLNCHRQAGESFRDVFKASGLSDTSTYRYGNAPGYDSILGAPFFSDQALNGFNRFRVDTTMRPQLAPYFERYDPARHPSSAYRRTEAYPVTKQPLRSSRQY
jgi:cytochrome c553